MLTNSKSESIFYHDEPAMFENDGLEFLGHMVPLSGIIQAIRGWFIAEQRANTQQSSQPCYDRIYMAIADNGEIVDAMLSCNPDQQSILVRMADELGVDWLAAQNELLRAVIAEEWPRAAHLLLDSVWAEQNWVRAWEYATILIYSVPGNKNQK